jgi:hypothetical protein
MKENEGWERKPHAPSGATAPSSKVAPNLPELPFVYSTQAFFRKSQVRE